MPSLPVKEEPTASPFESYPNTLVHALQLNAKRSPDHVMIEWVNSQCKVESSITYTELWEQSALVANILLKNGVKSGDRVMIAYPFGLEFLSGLFGCMRIGVIPCSVYPPNFIDKSKARFSFEQFNHQVKDAGAKFALTSTLFKRGLFVAALSGHKTGSLKWLASDKLKTKQPKHTELRDFEVTSKDIAFIQYSSGSTSSPKGVVITHGAIMHNIKALIDVMGDTGENRAVGWLPQYHDYGLLLGYVLPSVSQRSPVSVCSPLDFIRDPLLWADMIEKFGATHIAAPNFAYGLLARRMKAASRKLCCTKLHQANIAAEPIAPATLDAMKDIGILHSAIMPCYGLAEVCAYATTCVGDEIEIDAEDGVVSCGLIARNEMLGKFIRVASTEGKILDDGEVGEIYIRGPDLATGYWNKPDLDASFHCKLSDGDEYFATGDLGKIVSGHLYVVGRSKELIIINGRNVYPQDIERTIESEYPDIVRPGSTAAFQNTDADIGIVLEIRKTYTSLNDVSGGFSETSIRRLVSNACGVQMGYLKMLKEGSVPKTTSGKLKRVETRRLSVEGSWPAKKILYSSRTKSASSTLAEVPHDLSTSTLPESLLGAIERVEMRTDKLNEIFVDLRLDQHPELVSTWKSMGKTTRHLQLMCESIKQGVLHNLPSVVQFAHLLDRNRDWLPPNAEEILSDTLHSMFVQDFATREFRGNLDLFDRKMDSDQEYEDWLCRDMRRNEIPDDAQFLFVDGDVGDPLFGRLDAFAWMKKTSITKAAKVCVEWVDQNQPLQKYEGLNVLELNVLEATWMDKRQQLTENGYVGHWLFQRASDPVASSQGVELLWGHEHSSWSHVYKAWDLCFVAGLSVDPSAMIGKLLFPTLLHATNEEFMSFRAISLYCVSQMQTRRLLTSGSIPPPILSWEALKAFGILNKCWVESLSNEDFPGIPAGVETEWMNRFDKWHQSTVACHIRENVTETVTDGFLNGCSSAVQATGDSDSVDATFYSLLGPNMDMLASWDSNGLTSLLHAELISRVQESHQVTLSPNFHESHLTPDQLKRFIESSATQRFPVKLQLLEDLQKRSDLSASLSTPVLTLLQSVGIMLIFLIFALCLIPPYFVGMVMLPLRSTFEVGFNQRLIVWSWLPLVVPTFFLTFSIAVLLLKWLIVGRYRSTVMNLPSVSFLRWWFMDRLMDIWEVFVGSFIVETKLIWLMYRLMGARLALSCQVDSFIREFDLVRVGSHSSIEHQIRCRKFTPFTASQQPSLTFRSIDIGKACTVRGMLGPGVKLGDSSRVEKLAAVQEGCQVPNSISVKGSPAYYNGIHESEQGTTSDWLVLDTMKIAWLFVELYLFFTLFLLAQLVLNEHLPAGWRYSPLVYWILAISLSSGFGVFASILMKWLLIGRRRPDYNDDTPWHQFCIWVCDFHFRLVVGGLLPVTGVGRMWNVVLMLHGLDTDLASFYPNVIANFRPSMVDLIRVRRSFLSAVSFEGSGYIEVIDSSIGYTARVGPGVKIHRSIIPPRAVVEESIFDASFLANHTLPGSNLLDLLLRELSFPLCTVLVVLSFIPAYEIFIGTMYDATAALSILWLSLVLFVQCVTWTCLDRLIQFGLQLSHARVHGIIYPACLGVSAYNQVWNILQLCMMGTSLARVLLRFMGSRVEGDLWYFGREMYDFCKLTFRDKTLIDDAHIAGHYLIFDVLVLKAATAVGVVHPGTYCPGGATLQGSESGPWRVYLDSGGSNQETAAIIAVHDVEKPTTPL